MRIDNADRRLTPHGRRVGLINDAAWADHLAKQERMRAMRDLLERTRVNGEMLNALRKEVSGFEFPVSSESTQGGQPGDLDAEKLEGVLGLTLAQVLKRPEVRIEALVPLLARLMPDFFRRGGETEVSSFESPVSRNSSVVVPQSLRPEDSSNSSNGADTAEPVLETRNLKLETDFRLPAEIRNELKSVETEIKYSGYLDQQSKAIERLKRSEQRLIPDWFNYARVSGLSREMNEKLTRVRPRTLGQASRIPGVTPAAVSLINVYIEIQARQQAAASSLG